MKRMSRQGMLKIYQQSPEAVIVVLPILFDEMEKLRARVQQLENQGKKLQKQPQTASYQRIQ